MLTRGRLPVAVLGATGLVGRGLVRMLRDHPWFELAEVAASESSVGRRYDEAGAAPTLRLVATHLVEAPFALSALPGRVAAEVEPALAARGLLVCSNASALRMEPDVPLVVPEVNPEALDVLPRQRWADRGGGVITNPNCVAGGLAPVLAAIDGAWTIESGTVVTLQALSGAGLAGLRDPALAGNVVPHIAGEEEKIAAELGKILGRPIPLAVAVNRVPVAEGHLAHVFLRLASDPSPGDVTEALAAFTAPAAARGLPSLPERPIRVLDGADRPQPRLDADHEAGMGITVGRIRRAPGYDVALTVLSHNLVRGAAGACLANAELAVARLAAPSAFALAARRNGPAGSPVERVAPGAHPR